MLLTESLLGTSSTAANYIEDVFSTYLYTGNSTTGGTQTITNGVDLSTKGGMVWIKGRSAASDHVLFDTTRGAGTTASNNQAISSNLATAEDLGASYDFLSAFNTDGFTVKQGGTTTATRGTNYNNVTYASWTFRKQAKFFDVVTYTGTGTARTIAHNLGSVPGCIFIKRTSSPAYDWTVYHRSLGNSKYVSLNQTWGEQTSPSNIWNNADPTSSVFSVGTQNEINGSGQTYVAYLFAHDAGGFGAAGTDNVISCGSYTGNNTNLQSINLGYEPQFILIKSASIAPTDWNILDNMRGVATGGVDAVLAANSSAAEASPFDRVDFTATGFNLKTSSALYNETGTYIYIAIRRGPMKTPTSGTSVFQPNFGSDVTTYTTNFPLDMGWDGYTLGGATDFMAVGARLLGQASLATASTAAESTAIIPADFWRSNTSYRFNAYGNDCATYAFRRAPGFFDVVCYTGTGANRTVSHNLGVAPELMIVKQRAGSGYGQWFVYNSASGNTKVLELQDATSGAYADSSAWNNTSPTSSVFTVGTSGATNYSGSTFVAYLFATVAGVSKVGSYTGSGTTKQIDCGFTNGARFVLIRRTDSGGDWYLWDSARGIVAGNDPYLRLNSSSAQVTGTDYVDTYSAGFEISSTAPAAINANGGSFIFLAIA